MLWAEIEVLEFPGSLTPSCGRDEEGDGGEGRFDSDDEVRVLSLPALVPLDCNRIV